MTNSADTIAAIATAPGRGGIGILRVSGPDTARIAVQILGRTVPPRRAEFMTFRNQEGTVLDQGIALMFEAPASFTGEDVLELQGHGSPVALDLLLTRVLDLGARRARPGEFTERAFLNDKIDLAQAEAVADLVNSASRQAALGAARSLSGEFSNAVHGVDAAILKLRVFVEGALDFPEEEIDFLTDADVAGSVARIRDEIVSMLARARQGVLLTDGLQLVLAGPPNSGKSSLLNRLAGEDRAIVTEIPGTTRDVLSAEFEIDGLPVRILDTAGLRDTVERVEQEGVRRALKAIETADGILLVLDDDEEKKIAGRGARVNAYRIEYELPNDRLVVVFNKIDLTDNIFGEITGEKEIDDACVCAVGISALTGDGVDALRDAVKAFAGYQAGEGTFSARRRHIDGLQAAERALTSACRAATEGSAELAAEDLRAAHLALGAIVGTTTTDDLLGEIFSNFCIGK